MIEYREAEVSSQGASVPEITSPSGTAEGGTSSSSVTSADIVEQLIDTEFNAKIVAQRLDIDKARVYSAVAENYAQVSQAMRALRLVTLYETLGAADTALDVSLDKMDPDDLVKAHSQLQGAFEQLTRPASAGVSEGGGGFNLNVFLGKLPQRVRGNVEQLVDMDDAEFEQIANAKLVGSNEGDLAA